MSVEIHDERFSAVVGDDALALEAVGTGFDFTEGPVWHPYERHLIFSDMPGDHMRIYRAGRGIETFRRPSNKANGNTYDGEGRLVTCEHATSRVTRTEKNGQIKALASHYGGKELNSPNDIIVGSDGSIYFSDPTYGRMEHFGVPREQELEFQGIYRVAPENGEATLLADDFAQPNGLCFSRDEQRLFVNDTDRQHIRVFAVKADGTLSGGDLWAEPKGECEGDPDGMKVDSEDNLYCTGPGGIHIFAPDRACLGVILVPEKVANFSWGDDDMCSLYITASTSLYRTRVRVPGVKLF